MVIWNHPITNQKFKLRRIFIHVVSFNRNSSLQASKGKNIDLSENAKYRFILDKQSLQCLLKKIMFQKLLQVLTI